MNSPRLISAIATYCLFGAACAAALGEETDSAPLPQHFAQLLRIGDVLLVKSVSESPAYTVQLLSRAQAEEVQTAYAAYSELLQRREAIKAQLETEGQLSQRATLFVQQETLETEMADVSLARYSGPYAYEVAHVGEDFVALKKPGIEKFIPLRSIRDIYRSDTLIPSGRRRPSSSSASTAASRVQIRLQNTLATVVAAIVHKTYPDSKEKLTVGADANSLLLNADRTTIKRVHALIKTLDAAFPETPPPTNERGR